ncbi:MAG TPA: ATP-dependent RNA helicase RhlE [Gammaproteobacteria bacterium]
MSFSELGLAADIVRAVTEKGYSEPTPVQRQAIPVILQGGDIMAGAQTGTGKTAGFTLPLLHRLMAQGAPKGQRSIRALILTPTRELAAQVGESVELYGKHLPLKSTVIFGGVGINPQIDKLRKGVDILVATPGRLLDHAGQKTVDLSKVEILVLDEADRMLDMGFIHDIRKVLAMLPKQRQNLLFSATYSDEIKTLADGILKSPALIEVARRNTAAELVTQVVHPVDRERKRELLSFLIGSRNWRQVLVFTRTKHGANRLAEQLGKDGITAAAIHGNKSQGARTKALADFKSGAVRVLVATDIAARGLDIDQLPHVVNYELPNVPEDYVHRIGRTGRAGNEGEAMSLVCVDEHKLLKDIERLLKRDLPKEVIPGYDPDPTIKAEPIPNGRNSRGNSAPRRPQGQASGEPRRERSGNSQSHSAKPASASRGSRNTTATGNRNSAGNANGNRNAPGNGNRAAAPVNGNRAPAQKPRGNEGNNARSATPAPQRRNAPEIPALLGGGRRDR